MSSCVGQLTHVISNREILVWWQKDRLEGRLDRLSVDLLKSSSEVVLLQRQNDIISAAVRTKSPAYVIYPSAQWKLHHSRNNVTLHSWLLLIGVTAHVFSGLLLYEQGLNHKDLLRLDIGPSIRVFDTFPSIGLALQHFLLEMFVVCSIDFHSPFRPCR
jgi:hypothetical protein